MGSGSYSSVNRSVRADSLGYNTLSAEEIFTQRGISNEMNPYGLGIRESRDSAEHPESLAIIIALDETGSMGRIPHDLVKEGLPSIMDKIINAGIAHPQVLFLGVGDHKSDNAPIQVGQFESSDPLLDHWLTTVYLEGNGGGNGGESYSLAHYVAAFHTSIDCFEKRGQKGILFTIGDEPNHAGYPAQVIKNLFGVGEAGSYTSAELIAKAQEKYHVFHINLRPEGITQTNWKNLLGERCLETHDFRKIPEIIANTVLSVVEMNSEELSEIADLNNQDSIDNSQNIIL